MIIDYKVVVGEAKTLHAAIAALESALRNYPSADLHGGVSITAVPNGGAGPFQNTTYVAAQAISHA